MAFLTTAVALLIAVLVVFFYWNHYLKVRGYGGGGRFPAIPPRGAEATERWIPAAERDVQPARRIKAS